LASSHAALLDNITWHCLSGNQAGHASGDDRARRYAKGFSGIVGFPEPHSPDLDALAKYCEPGERFYILDWTGPVTNQWRIEMESRVMRMVWDAPMPQEPGGAEPRRLGARDVPAALELAALTKPGPFAARTIELGDYFGYFDGERLVAMAGERMWAGTLREISGVCTHPEHQGRGHARALMLRLARRQLARGETPFLHVMSANPHAIALYGRLGFARYAEYPIRVIERR
jgi:ribosomal protein S18 acetylase RimI-like enzyme